MLHQTMKPSEGAGVVANIDPDAYTANTYESGWVDMAKFDAIMAVFQAGDLGSSATAICKLQHATDSGGTGAEDITGKTAATLTQAGTDSNKQVVIHCRPEDMVGALLSFKAGTARFVRAVIVIGVATSDFGAVVLGFHPRNGDMASLDASTVDEIL